MSWFDLQTQPTRTMTGGMPTFTNAAGQPLAADPYNPGDGQHFYNPAYSMTAPQNALAAAQPVNTTTGMNLGQTAGQPNITTNTGSIGGFFGGDPSGNPLVGDSLLSPWTQQFAAPSPEQIAKDPAYQFQLQQGLQGVDRSAAAKGTLLTGGTLKALDAYGQGLASTYNDKYYDRALQNYLMNQNTFYQNQDRPFTKLSSLATLGKPSSTV